MKCKLSASVQDIRLGSNSGLFPMSFCGSGSPVAPIATDSANGEMMRLRQVQGHAHPFRVF